MKQVIALDVGGTSVKSGVVEPDGTVCSDILTTDSNSESDEETILMTFAEIVREHMAQVRHEDWVGIGFGFPSPFEYEKGVARITGQFKFDAIYGVNIGDDLRSRVDVAARPIRFRNDAEAAIIGECLYGAGRAYERLIGITLGTGLGSSFVDKGVRLTSGPGIPEGGFLFDEPVAGVRADDVFSRRGLEHSLARFGVEVDIPSAAEKARKFEPMTRIVFEKFGANLGQFLRPYAEQFSAEAVLLLGGIARTFDLFGPSLAEALSVPVVLGERPKEAALLGAAELIFGGSG
jgi:glucokinase